MTITISPIKRGDSFTVVGTYKEGGVATSLTPLTLRSQVRNNLGALIEELTVTKAADQVATPGAFTLAAAAPIDWPAGTLTCDIQFFDGTTTRSTQTFNIPVEKDITR